MKSDSGYRNRKSMPLTGGKLKITKFDKIILKLERIRMLVRLLDLDREEIEGEVAGQALYWAWELLGELESEFLEYRNEKKEGE